MNTSVKPVPRIAAIHDLSGFGKASLTVVIPILSTLGIQVCPLATAVLSTHSMIEGYRFVDLTEHMRQFVAHWKELEIDFDAVYSGFLGSANQVAIVEEVIQAFARPRQLVVVDPVLGDDGRMYGPLQPAMVAEMRRLVRSADVITPNLTEAALLLEEPFQPVMEPQTVKAWLRRLAAFGPRIVIITSVKEKKPGRTAVLAFDKQDGRFWKVGCDYIPANYPGTGDSFASVVVGCLLQGDSLPIALDRAVQFISIAIRSTFGYARHPREGIVLERVLHNLKAPVQVSSYELLD